MPKSLKDIIRAGRNVSKGEENFIDQHKVTEKDYPVKQKSPDASHKAGSVKHVSNDRHGNIEPGESERKYKEANEDVEIDEVLKSSDPTSKWISDFVHSKNPKFAGKSKEKRIQMALGAKYAKMREERTKCNMTEEGVMCEVHGMKNCKESAPANTPMTFPNMNIDTAFGRV